MSSLGVNIAVCIGISVTSLAIARAAQVLQSNCKQKQSTLFPVKGGILKLDSDHLDSVYCSIGTLKQFNCMLFVSTNLMTLRIAVLKPFNAQIRSCF